MGKQRVGAILLFSYAVSVLATGGRAASVIDFIDFSLRGDNGELLLPGRLYVPSESLADPDASRPLILFLHGAGERGTNNVSQINLNIDNLLAEAKQRGAFLYAPQSNTSWADLMVTMHIDAMLGRALSEQGVDPFRLYVTGLSMGGGGVWNLMHRYPDRFAAGVPIAAIAPAAGFNPANLTDQSTWAFHARNDSVVHFSASRNAVNSILSAVGEAPPNYPGIRDTTTFFEYASSALDLRYTEPPSGGHGIWPLVYGFEPMYDWMFARTTAVPEPSVGVLLIAGIGSMLILQVRRRRETSDYLK